MTLGPALVALGLLERARGAVADFFLTFGRVPMFYYLLHMPLIHGLAVVAGVLGGFQAREFLQLFVYFPKEYGFSLPVVYGVWVTVVLLLYLPCRWFADLKSRRRDLWFLSYL